MVKEGDTAPGFSLEDDTGKKISLSDFAGKKVVLYFYPRDDTPGCTKEACSFRDEYDEILAKGAIVIGISADPVASHGRFRNKYSLPFYLLSDPDKKVMQLYGAWGEKKMYGKIHMGTIRSTFIIGVNGKIQKVFPKVTPEGHGKEVLEYL